MNIIRWEGQIGIELNINLTKIYLDLIVMKIIIESNIHCGIDEI